MNVKSAPARFKADAGDTEGTGEFEAVVSVFDNVDSWGDVVVPGAFAETIAQWKASPDTLPVLWSHRMDDPGFNIGAVLDIKELGPGDDSLPEWVDLFVKEHGGLWVKGLIDTGPDASPTARQAYRLLKERRVTQFSYAYDVIDAGWSTKDGEDAWELRKLKLYEVSPTQIGANELTELLAAKARGLKVGRALSAKNEDNLRQAASLITETLKSLDSTDDGDKAKREEPNGVKREEPDRTESLRVMDELAAAERELDQ